MTSGLQNPKVVRFIEKIKKQKSVRTCLYCKTKLNIYIALTMSIGSTFLRERCALLPFNVAANLQKEFLELQFLAPKIENSKKFRMMEKLKSIQ
jgi:hypothetical protein